MSSSLQLPLSSSASSSSATSSSSSSSVSVSSNDTNTTSFTSIINSTSVVLGNDGISRYPVHRSTIIEDDDSNLSKVDENIPPPSFILLEAKELSKLIIKIATKNMSIQSKYKAIHMFPNHCVAIILIVFYFMENCANEDDAGNL